MKTLTIVFLLFCAVTFNSYSQYDYKHPKTAGDYLIKAKEYYNISLVLGGIAIVGSTAISINSNSYTPAIIVGSSVGLAAAILRISAWQCIGKAGKLMNEKGLTMDTKHGVGLCYKF